jgi:hypothetical protein
MLRCGVDTNRSCQRRVFVRTSCRCLQVRYHPDKVPAAAPLAERVRAEEISKILNSWNTSSLR